MHQPVPAGSPCQYDEGSPLVQIYTDPVDATTKRLFAVGIMSRTSTCAADVNSVYTRLSAHYAWLLKTAGPQG